MTLILDWPYHCATVSFLCLVLKCLNYSRVSHSLRETIFLGSFFTIFLLKSTPRVGIYVSPYIFVVDLNMMDVLPTPLSPVHSKLIMNIGLTTSILLCYAKLLFIWLYIYLALEVQFTSHHWPLRIVIVFTISKS